jgi:hypothetical protein
MCRWYVFLNPRDLFIPKTHVTHDLTNEITRYKIKILLETHFKEKALSLLILSIISLANKEQSRICCLPEMKAI